MAQKTREPEINNTPEVDPASTATKFETREAENTSKNHKAALEDLAGKSTAKKTISQEEYDQILLQLESTKIELNSLTLENELLKEKGLRLSAELQNIQKQHELDILQAKKVAKKNSLSSLVNFINTLQLAFNFIPQDINEGGLKFIDTLKNSFDKLITDLSGIGVEILTPKVGDTFNPENMQALNSATDSDNPIIKQIISLGVMIDGTLITPVMVTLE